MQKKKKSDGQEPTEKTAREQKMITKLRRVK